MTTMKMTTKLIHFSRLLDRYRPYYNQSSGLKVEQHLARLNRLEKYQHKLFVYETYCGQHKGHPPRWASVVTARVRRLWLQLTLKQVQQWLKEIPILNYNDYYLFEDQRRLLDLTQDEREVARLYFQWLDLNQSDLRLPHAGLTISQHLSIHQETIVEYNYAEYLDDPIKYKLLYSVALVLLR